MALCPFYFFFSSRRRHTRSLRDWSSDVCSSDLGRVLRRIDADYRRVHGLAVLAVETFTDPSRHAGTCYAAAGFVRVGASEGYGRRRGAEHYTFHGQPKTYWLRPLHRHALAVLADRK